MSFDPAKLAGKSGKTRSTSYKSTMKESLSLQNIKNCNIVAGQWASDTYLFGNHTKVLLKWTETAKAGNM